MNPFQLPDTFYPTPPQLVSKMLDCIDFMECSSFLEPSAGDGAIAWGIAERCVDRYSGHDHRSVDCIELDDHLRALLRHRFGEERQREYSQKHSELDTWENRRDPQLAQYGRMKSLCSFPARLVHDDFLSYRPLKQYDAMVMNPPFDCGDRHLLHALDIMQGGGQIVCLLNADTLRNPYSNMRKALLGRIEDLDAKIEYLTGEFEVEDARRKTAVDVALVSITIPRPEPKSDIFERLQKARELEAEVVLPEGLIRLGDGVAQAVEQFDIETKCGLALIREYEGLRPYMMQDFNDAHTRCILTMTVGTDRNILQELDVNEYMRETRLKYWRALCSNPEFTGMLTSNLLDELRSSVEKMADYDFTAFNITQLLDDLQARLSQGVEDTIMALFDKLTVQYAHHSEYGKTIHLFSGWKTNKAYKIGKKAIIPTNGMFADYSWAKEAFKVHEANKVLSDIEKVLNYLDNGVTGHVDLHAVLVAAAESGQTRNIPCKYFDVDLYKKGTTHIKFRDSAIVDKLNIYGSRRKGWLPPRYGKARYQDLSREEKAIVDDFQGKEAYEIVCADPGRWIVEPTNMLLLGA